jgi:5,5'-dehydrodivanillate O-demethylase
MDTEGVLEARAYYRSYNLFSGLDNAGDPVHLIFTHRQSNIDVRGGFVGVPRISAEESAWGMTLRAERSGEWVRVTQIGFPNMVQFPGSPDASGSGWTTATLWRTPIDDEQHIEFVVERVPLQGAVAEKYARRRAAELDRSSAPVDEVARAVLRGDLATDEIGEHAHLVAIQDAVTQGGQGVIADREHEHLGRNDVGVILYRNLWLRELQALAEGRPLKVWTKPAGLLPGRG